MTKIAINLKSLAKIIFDGHQQKASQELQLCVPHSEKLYEIELIVIDVIPLTKLRMAAVMKMLKTLLKTSASKTARRDPPGLQAIITIA